MAKDALPDLVRHAAQRSIEYGAGRCASKCARWASEHKAYCSTCG
jgi:hypothetical protein